MSRVSLPLDNTDLAEHYEKISAVRRFRVGKELVAALGIGPGDRVMDVGSGTGLLSGHIFGLVGPGGSVTGIDPLPLRIEIARQRRNAATTSASRSGRIKARTSVIAIEEDVFFPLADISADQRLMPGSVLKRVSSDWGHLSLFGTDPGYNQAIGGQLGELLASY
jgi:SAM-dependent methyltransferase